MIKFSQLIDKFQYPPRIRAKLSTMHASIITYAIVHFQNTLKFKTTIVYVLNLSTYYCISGDTIPKSWNFNNPLDNVPDVDPDIMYNRIGNRYLSLRDIDWDVSECDDKHVISVQTSRPTKNLIDQSSGSTTNLPTPKEDLYIRPPVIPQFDVKKPWLHEYVNGQEYMIYTSLPLIPENQSQISVTTDISRLKPSDFLNLFPNHCIHTRSPAMYEPYGDLDYDPVLGVIFPISGFTLADVKDNILRYPHIYKLLRYLDDKYVSFYQYIELDGEIHKVLDVWNDIPDSRYIPKSSEYVKEYVVRRFLLERDKLHLNHKSRLYGTLEPFLTLFMPACDYVQYGYSDALGLATQCVQSRISYKQSRNPILQMIKAVNQAI